LKKRKTSFIYEKGAKLGQVSFPTLALPRSGAVEV